jgi:hypothetical protein
MAGKPAAKVIGCGVMEPDAAETRLGRSPEMAHLSALVSPLVTVSDSLHGGKPLVSPPFVASAAVRRAPPDATGALLPIVPLNLHASHAASAEADRPAVPAGAQSTQHPLRGSLNFPQLRPDLRKELMKSASDLLRGDVLQDDAGTTPSILRGRSSVVSGCEDLITAVLLCIVSGQDLLINLMQPETALEPGEGNAHGQGGTLVYELIRRLFAVEIHHRRYSAGDRIDELLDSFWNEKPSGQLGGGEGDARGSSRRPESSAPGSPLLEPGLGLAVPSCQVLVVEGVEEMPDLEQTLWEESSCALQVRVSCLSFARIAHAGSRL